MYAINQCMRGLSQTEQTDDIYRKTDCDIRTS